LVARRVGLLWAAVRAVPKCGKGGALPARRRVPGARGEHVASVEKRLRFGGGWLASDPERETITRSDFKHSFGPTTRPPRSSSPTGPRTWAPTKTGATARKRPSRSGPASTNVYGRMA